MTTYKKYDHYKNSGVEWLGEVPEHWQVSTLNRVVSFNPRPTAADRESALDVSFLPMSAVGTDGSLDRSVSRPFSELDGSYTFFREGDLCYAKVTPCFENGKAAVLTGLKNGLGFGSTELTVITPNKTELTSVLKYYLKLPAFLQLGTFWMTGTAGLQRVPDQFTKHFAFFDAPLPEQRAIATYLDRETAKIDALIEKKEKLIALLDEKRQALISHAVTKGLNPNAPMKDSGVEWLGEVPAHWEVRRLRYVSTINPAPHTLPSSLQVSFVPMARINTDGTYDNSDVRTIEDIGSGYTAFQENDVAFAKVTPCFENGKGALFHGLNNGYGFGTSEITILRPSSTVTSKWLFAITQTHFFRQMGRSSMSGVAGLQRVSNDFVANFTIPIPLTNEQTEITDFIDSSVQRFDALTKKTQKSIALLREKRSALITAAVTGQIDVRDEVA